LVAELKRKGITEAYLEAGDERTDILRLTLIENGIALRASPGDVILRSAGQGFEAVRGRLRAKPRAKE
jgi:hypothetical protein